MNKKKQHFRWLTRIRPEMFIMLGIIFCVVYLMRYDQHVRMDGVISVNNGGSIVLLHTKEDIAAYKKMNRPIIDYKPDACRLIEVFDSDVNLQFRMSFVNIPENYDPMTLYPEVKEMCKNNVKGSMDINVDGIPVTVHVRRIRVDSETEFIMLYSSDKNVINELVKFTFICYLTIVLCFTMLISIIYWQCKGISNYYKRVTQEYYDKIR